MLAIHQIIRTAFVLASLGLTTTLFGQQPTEQPSKANAKDAFLDKRVRHLMVLTMKLPHYKVKEASPIEALEAVWKTALNESPTLINFEYEPFSNGSPANKISLDLENTLACEIIGYIAELSARKWQLSGLNGVLLSLSLIDLGKEDYGEFNYGANGFTLTEKGAALLGIKAGMKPRAVMTVLQRFGVKFDETSHDIAAYDAKHQGLAVAAKIAEVRFVEALVRLANAGIKMEVPAQ